MTYARKPQRQTQASLVQGHMPLVRKIAWHVHGRVSNAIDIEDLVQIGMVALVEAANGYEDRGHAFSTYAGMRVRGAMIDHLRRHASQARSGMAKRKEIAKVRAEIEGKLGRAASEAEMAQAMGLDATSFREMADAAESVRHESLDEVYSDQSMWFADLEEGADEQLDRGRLGEALAEHIAQLPEREAMVLQLYFVEELNLEEIGQVLDIGAARVCQIKKSALDKLRGKLADFRE
ncbi:sigma-70 family RNA polymerase sigma factor [Sphingomonas oryzagri]|uniref:FliA/WhiG family RNA polymerase sigma factor n=1 Tax=Sphingomonas oryzagri TaxID=3042314 RepID=A0ABT6N3J9_9SPHN|nr:FliA/WhiG family RNA polymerase sigma factor [Sphingomonas oryzagri]MDH7639626.1 FliA/WhiG family RNA polymerase sigma factor [Sphingomonas oryzagri]